MKQSLALLFVAVALVPTAVLADTRQADPPLVVNGDLALTTRDFEAYMERVPVERRDEFRAEWDKINPTVDGLWVRRVLAKKARDLGMDKDPVMEARLRLVQEDMLSGAYLARVARNLKFPNLEPRAREIYAANQKSFMIPEIVKVQHILVSTKTRSSEEAAERAKSIYAEAKAGKEDFLALAARYSDDRNSGGTIGDLPPSPPSVYEPPIPAELAKVRVPGTIAEPIRTKYGFHIFKLISRDEPKLKPFEEVKQSIIDSEIVKMADEAKTAEVDAVRADPKTHLYLENVQALKSNFDPAAAEAAKATEAARAKSAAQK